MGGWDGVHTTWSCLCCNLNKDICLFFFFFKYTSRKFFLLLNINMKRWTTNPCLSIICCHVVHGERTTSNLSLHPSRTVACCDGLVVEVSFVLFSHLKQHSGALFLLQEKVYCAHLQTLGHDTSFHFWDYYTERRFLLKEDSDIFRRGGSTAP